MNSATIKFEAFEGLQNDECQKRILDAKKKLGKKIIILGHHYQNESVYKHADLTGDSLKLAKYVSNLEAKYIIFLGVHFMAEVANILGRANQITVLPDLAAGCSMADMANLTKVERTFRELSKVMNFDEKIITYEKILKTFFQIHDPTTLNSQGPDFGTQYRSEIFYLNDNQKMIAEKVLNEVNERLSGKVVTKISLLKNYCPAEEYHQKYLEKR